LTVQIFGFSSDRPPTATHVAASLAQVRPLLAAAEAASRKGRWVAVAVSYDAAAAFDPAMRPARDEADALPLAWAAEFDEMSRDVRATSGTDAGEPAPEFAASIDEGEFCRRVRLVQAHIDAGDTYQVNLTFPTTAVAPHDTRAWYERLRRTQQTPYAAYLDLGRHLILSLSPELFFECDGRIIRTRPMKGTIRRGRWLAEDDALARALASSRKAQAENVMIVDLLRNDIGRVAETGSVRVPSLFSVHRYPTLWQMTSDVEGRLRDTATLPAIFDALFPCGSVTGAPKIRTMEIIGELEGRPRGLYTGAIGLLEPGGRTTFSVAIRTIVIDRESGAATMGIGAGITADSVAEDEYAECLLKATFTARTSHAHADAFLLLETMRLEEGVVIRLDRHLRRLQDSARYFGFTWDEPRVRAAVHAAAAAHASGVWRCRLTMDPTGSPDVTCTPHSEAHGALWRIALANMPIDENDPFMFHKTTSRQAYDAARRARPDTDDVLLWNGRREITESTIANVVVEIDGKRYTPPIECGLLAGTLRAELIDTGEVQERAITCGEVIRAPRLWLINSLRGWIDAVIVR
jgi:para-aminobenzoate synthetase / 4-amino-4-deoxychorismate lyase